MNKEILRLAIPNIITNITVPLLGMVDTAIAGHLNSELYIGAIALAATIFNFIYWNFGFLRMGTSGFTAQAYGATNRKEMMDILIRSLIVAFSIAFLILLFRKLILGLAFHFVEGSNELRLYVSYYFNIYIWAAPAVLGMYAVTGWFIGMQDARTPMFISISANLVNIGVSLCLVMAFNLQIKGVAIGSLTAQWFAFLISLFIWNKKYGFLKPFLHFGSWPSVRSFQPFFKVNTDIFLRSLALVSVTTFFTYASSRPGELTLAANALLMQFFILFSYMMDGFAYAAEALTGRFTGAKKSGQLRVLVKKLFLSGIVLSLLFTCIYGIFADPILRLLTDKENVIAIAREYKYWVLLFPAAGFAAFLWDGIYIGMTASRQMRNSMFVAVIVFLLLIIACIR